MSDFFDLLRRLVNADFDFVLVGGFAGVVHGCTYVTQDIDICCDFSKENLLKLQAAISDVNPVHRMTPKKLKFVLDEEGFNCFKNLYLDTDIGPLDCLGFIDGVGDFQKVKKAAVDIEVESMRLKVLSLDALIEAKKAMKRPHDMLVLKQLKAIKQLRNPDDT